MNKFTTTALLLTIFLISGCSLVGVSKNSKKPAPSSLPLSGVYKTVSAGDQWSQSDEMYSLKGQVQRIAYSTVSFMKSDPNDMNTIYLGTDRGLYYTYNRGDGWFSTLTGVGTINDLAFHPVERCRLYAAAHSKIFTSADCGRNWSPIHWAALPNEYFNTIVVSRHNPNTVFAGSSLGTLLESIDGGTSWHVKKYLSTGIGKIIPHPHENNILYLIAHGIGIQRTADEGVNWTSLMDLPVYDSANQQKMNGTKPVLLRDLPGSNTYYDLKFDYSQSEGLVYANAYGIFRLFGNNHWQEIEILNRPTKLTIYAVDIDGIDGKNIFFTTDGEVYRSDNGGKDWTVKSLPSSGVPRFLILMPKTIREFLIAFIAPAKK